MFTAGLGAALTIPAWASKASAASAKTRPNIILFIADDMRYDVTGYLGNRYIKTPNLDALAKNSLVFTNNFVTTSICPTSRATIMSGEYALKHKVYNFVTSLSKESLKRSFPVLLREQGYYTGYVGKWGIGELLPEKEFDYWQGYKGQGTYFSGSHSEHLTDLQTKQALGFFDSLPAHRPFLLIVGYKAPHGPWVPQPRFEKLYENTIVPRRESDTKKAYAALPKLLKRGKNRTVYQKNIQTDPQYQTFIHQYYQLISGMDESIGLILKRTKKANLLDNTHVLFTSDNGLLTGEHGLMGKFCMYEESIRTPLLIKPAGPPVSKTVRSDLTLNVDLAPTILAMASITPPASMKGNDLLKPFHREGFYYEHPADPVHAQGAMHRVIACEGYRDGDWKYTRYVRKRFHNECLFDLKHDPYELTNLAKDKAYAEQLKSMRDKAKQEKERLLADG